MSSDKQHEEDLEEIVERSKRDDVVHVGELSITTEDQSSVFLVAVHDDGTVNAMEVVGDRDLRNILYKLSLTPENPIKRTMRVTGYPGTISYYLEDRHFIKKLYGSFTLQSQAFLDSFINNIDNDSSIAKINLVVKY